MKQLSKKKSNLIVLSSELHNYIKEYIDEYEFRADEGDYSPTEHERLIIYDAIQGLLIDNKFIKKWTKWRESCC